MVGFISLLTYNWMRQTIYITPKYKKYNTIYTVHNQDSLFCPRQRWGGGYYETKIAAPLAVLWIIHQTCFFLKKRWISLGYRNWQFTKSGEWTLHFHFCSNSSFQLRLFSTELRLGECELGNLLPSLNSHNWSNEIGNGLPAWTATTGVFNWFLQAMHLSSVIKWLSSVSTWTALKGVFKTSNWWTGKTKQKWRPLEICISNWM